MQDVIHAAMTNGVFVLLAVSNNFLLVVFSVHFEGILLIQNIKVVAKNSEIIHSLCLSTLATLTNKLKQKAFLCLL